MEQYIIKGGNPLVGEVEIGGAYKKTIRNSQESSVFNNYIKRFFT